MSVSKVGAGAVEAERERRVLRGQRAAVCSWLKNRFAVLAWGWDDSRFRFG